MAQPKSFVPENPQAQPSSFVPDSFVPDEPVSTEAQPQQEPSLWDRIWTPLQHYGEQFGESITEWLNAHPEYEEQVRQGIPYGAGNVIPKGYISEYPHAFGMAADRLTSPGNIALTGLTGGTNLAARQGYTTVAREGGRLLGLAGTAQAGHGIYEATQAKDATDILNALIDTGMGGWGIRQGAAALRGNTVRPSASTEPKIVGSGKTAGATAPTPPDYAQTFGDIVPNELPKIITVREPTPAKVAQLKQLGYEPAGVNSENYPQMVLTSLSNVNKSGQAKPTDPLGAADWEFRRLDREYQIASSKDPKGPGTVLAKEARDAALKEYKKIKAETARNKVKTPQEEQIDQIISDTGKTPYGQIITINDPGAGAIKKLANQGWVIQDVAPDKTVTFKYSKRGPRGRSPESQVIQKEVPPADLTEGMTPEQADKVTDLFNRFRTSVRNDQVLNPNKSEIEFTENQPQIQDTFDFDEPQEARILSFTSDAYKRLQDSVRANALERAKNQELINQTPETKQAAVAGGQPETEAPQEMAIQAGPEFQVEETDPERTGRQFSEEENKLYQAQIDWMRHQAYIANAAGKTELARNIMAEAQTLAEELAKYEIGINPTRPDFPDTTQHMKVPGVRTGKSKLENIAIGPRMDEPRLLDILSGALYTGNRPRVTMKELIQNANDEYRIANITDKPIRIIVDTNIGIPKTPAKGKSITVRDYGRGLTPEQMYTVLTDVGKSGKGSEAKASGGFGFAKAAPFLGGQYTRVKSVVEIGGAKYEITFEGNPRELKNQVLGVPLEQKVVPPDTPTGLEVTTWYDSKSEFYSARNLPQYTAEHSSSFAPVEFVDTGGTDVNVPGMAKKDFRDAWLEGKESPTITDPEKYKYQYDVFTNAKRFEPKGLPELVDTVVTPGAKINLHYDRDKLGEQTSYDIYALNKGLYQATIHAGYGVKVEKAPGELVADIEALVEEDDPRGLYPFGLNREAINDNITKAIDDWVHENITKGAEEKAAKELAEKYGNVVPFAGSNVFFLDEKGQLLPAEIQSLAENPAFQDALTNLESVHRATLQVADTIGWQAENIYAQPHWTKPSARLKKFGLLFQSPKSGNVTLGIHIPNPSNKEESAILINLMEHLNMVANLPDSLDRLSTGLLTTISHEIAHIPGGGHDQDFAYRHAALLEHLGRRGIVDSLRLLAEAFGDINSGRINPEILDLLRIYNESRQRQIGEANALLDTGTNIERPQYIRFGQTKDNSLATGGEGNSKTIRPRSIPKELYNLTRGLTTSWDLSAAGRQGLTAITYPEWWGAWGKEFEALGSEEAFQKQNEEIMNLPLFQKRFNPKSGKVDFPSVAEEFGLELTGVKGYGKGAKYEELQSELAEAVPGVRASNRAYQAFLNHIRAYSFQRLIINAQRAGWEPLKDVTLGKEIAQLCNDITGRGSLGKYQKHIGLLSDVFFAPKLVASRISMLNPMTYVMAHPFVRRQYLRSMFGLAGFWFGVAALAKAAGADVSTDMDNADFGKIRIGNTRFDPAGGFQQYLVLMHRLYSGRTVSSASERAQELGRGYKAPTRTSIAQNFMLNKLHPVVRFGWDLFDASQYKKFHVFDRIAQLFIPLAIQDAIELFKTDPALMPGALASIVGMGTQTYEKGDTDSKIIPEDWDITLEGGAPPDELAPPF